ncbi:MULTISPECIES: hypothetical protein [Staphylococcus]|uniref:hypothetical protein n=1 Tax=Staphylococcus TaxID=1279 RepID=UPI001C82B490|nr:MULTISPECIES: hypothetical protein [Staphylococcus]MBX5319292.1 hypothetical protein [Staphylococcus caprae]MCR6086921.1 hypothetical protein [Staphylococcus aureus]
MAKDKRSEDKIEVIDPDDSRYKDDDYFKNHQSTYKHHQYENGKTINKTYSYGCTHTGCGCSIVCFSIMFISFLLSMLIYWLF